MKKQGRIRLGQGATLWEGQNHLTTLPNQREQIRSKETTKGGRRDGTVYPSKGPRFNPQDPRGSSQVSVTAVPETLTPPQGHTRRQNTNVHKFKTSK